MKTFHKTAMDMIQRSSLQIALTTMSVVALVFAILNLLSSLKDPIIIERGCDSKLAQVQSSTQSKDEIETFISLALSSRFDSILKNDPAIYLTEGLQAVRAREQNELRNKNIDQRINVRSVRFDQGKYIVEADRLISVGKIRTAVPLDLVLDLASKIRSISNQYGLVLTEVVQIKGEQSAK